jgi:hypothetical protein
MKTPKRLMLLIVLLGVVSPGCQTFTLTEEDFDRQQRGKSDDSGVGAAVGAAGTIGYLGALIGCAAAGVK